MLLKIHPDNPDPKKISQVVDCLKGGGVIAFPTDTVYGIGCDLMNHRAMEKVAKIKGLTPEKANFSIICNDLSNISDFTKPIDTIVFKLMKKYLPGPFTFILAANNNTPKLFRASKKREIGIRVPDNNIPLEVVKKLGNPMITTSIHNNSDIIEYITDPELIYDRYKRQVDIVIHGGYGQNIASTIVNCVDKPFIVRQGLKEIDELI